MKYVNEGLIVGLILSFFFSPIFLLVLCFLILLMSLYLYTKKSMAGIKEAQKLLDKIII